jgi:hypothetical protein
VRTHVYLDVDGVINAVTNAAPPPWGWECETSTTTVDGWPITWATDLVDRLNALADLPNVEIFWLTTWNTRAPELLAPALGINGTDWEVLGIADQYSSEHTMAWWKLPIIQRHMAETSPEAAVWVDDDIAFDAAAVAWASSVENLLTISPRSSVGITRDEFDIIDRAATIGGSW